MKMKHLVRKFLIRMEMRLHPNKCRLNSEGMYEQRKLITICLDSPYEVEWVSSMGDIYAVSYKLIDEIKPMVDLTNYKNKSEVAHFRR